MLAEFDNHPVTKEIEAGPDPSVKSISGSLSEGNLFSFLGFNFGDNPTREVRNVLEDDVRLATGVRRESDSSKARFRFSLRIPNQRINEVAKLPWQAGKSWVNAVQQGLSGFNHYLWKKFIGAKSRSFYGIQTDGTVKNREESSKPVEYINQIFDRMVERLKR